MRSGCTSSRASWFSLDGEWGVGRWGWEIRTPRATALYLPHPTPYSPPPDPPSFSPTTPPSPSPPPISGAAYAPVSRSTRLSILSSRATFTITACTKRANIERPNSTPRAHRGLRGSGQESVRSRRPRGRRPHLDRRLLPHVLGHLGTSGRRHRRQRRRQASRGRSRQAAAHRRHHARPLDPARLRRLHLPHLHRGLPPLLRAGAAVGRRAERHRRIQRGSRTGECPPHEDIVTWS